MISSVMCNSNLSTYTKFKLLCTKWWGGGGDNKEDFLTMLFCLSQMKISKILECPKFSMDYCAVIRSRSHLVTSVNTTVTNNKICKI